MGKICTLTFCMILAATSQSYAQSNDIESELMAESLKGELHFAKSKENRPRQQPGKNDIQIKGLWIGMDQEEINEKFGLPIDNFTIAGVPAKDRVTLRFDENRLNSLHFSFNSENFSEVRDSVVLKYPEIKCKDSIAGNLMGATFPQVECYLKREKSTLVLEKMSSDIHTSSLSLISNDDIKKSVDKRKDNLGDI